MIGDDQFDPFGLISGGDLKTKLLGENFSLFGLNPQGFQPRYRFGSPIRFGQDLRLKHPGTKFKEEAYD